MKTSFYPQRNTGGKSEYTQNKRIYIRISLGNNQYIKIKSNLFVPDLKYWDSKNQRCVKTKIKDKLIKEKSVSLNASLDKTASVINDTISGARRYDPQITKDELELLVKEKLGIDKIDRSFFGILKIFIGKKKDNQHTHEEIKKYENLQRHLEDFQMKWKEPIKFSGINKQFGEDFISFLNRQYKDRKPISNNSANQITGNLKIFIKWSIDNNYSNSTSYKNIKLVSKPAETIVLTEKEVKALEDLDLSDNPRLQRVQQLCLFSIYCGARFSDIINLKKEDVRNGFWFLRVVKTSELNEIPLIDKALAILEKYDGEFKIINVNNYNQYLKEVGKLASIDESITKSKMVGKKRVERTQPKYMFLGSHIGRRSFITISLMRGMPVHVCMKITGHRTLSSFEKYIKLSSTDLRNAMDKYWGTSLRDAEINA